MFTSGLRGMMLDQNGKPRPHGSTLSLGKLIQSFGYTLPCTLHNAGNDAFMCLWALQMLFDGPEKVKAPVPRGAVIATQSSLHNSMPSLRNYTMSLDSSRTTKPRVNHALSVSIPDRPQPQRVASAPAMDEHGRLHPHSAGRQKTRDLERAMGKVKLG